MSATQSTIERAIQRQDDQAAAWPLPVIKEGMRVRVDYSHPDAKSQYITHRHHGRIGRVTKENACGRPLPNQPKTGTPGGLWYVQLLATTRYEATKICISGAALLPAFEHNMRVKIDLTHPEAKNWVITAIYPDEKHLFAFVDRESSTRESLNVPGGIWDVFIDATFDELHTRLKETVPGVLMTPVAKHAPGFWPTDDEDLPYAFVVEHGLLLQQNGPWTRYFLGGPETRCVWVNDQEERIGDPDADDETSEEDGDDE